MADAAAHLAGKKIFAEWIAAKHMQMADELSIQFWFPNI